MTGPRENVAGGTPKLRSKGLPADTKVIASWRNTRTIVAHADYAAAKAGDTEAAARLITDVVKPETVDEAAAAFGDDVPMCRCWRSSNPDKTASRP